MTRIGLFLNFIGALLLVLELIGAQRLRKAERFLERRLSTIANPRKYYKAITNFLKQGKLLFLKKFLLFYLPSVVLYLVSILLFDMLFGTAILRWVSEDITIVLYSLSWFYLYTGIFAFISLVCICVLTLGSRNDSIQRIVMAVWLGADIIFIIGFIIVIPRFTMFLILAVVFRIVFVAILFLVLLIASLPLQMGFSLQKRYGFKFALPLIGIILLTIGFVFQFIGTF